MTNAKVVKPAGLGPEISAREAWKLFGIMAEFFEATEKLANIKPAVSVFGSARTKPGTPYYKLAEETARLLSDAGFAVISGGGPGLMEAANSGAMEGQVDSHARSFGLAIHLPTEEGANPFVNKVFRHRTFFSRLHHFVRLSSAFIVFPGGIGSALELFMVWQLLQVKHMTEHPLILVGTMWNGLIEWMQEAMIERGLASPPDLDIVTVVASSDEAIPLIRASYEQFKEEKANANARAGA